MCQGSTLEFSWNLRLCTNFRRFFPPNFVGSAGARLSRKARWKRLTGEKSCGWEFHLNPKDQRLHPPMEKFAWQIGDLGVRWFGIRIGNNPFHNVNPFIRGSKMPKPPTQTTNLPCDSLIPSVGWKNVESLLPESLKSCLHEINYGGTIGSAVSRDRERKPSLMAGKKSRQSGQKMMVHKSGKPATSR